MIPSMEELLLRYGPLITAVRADHREQGAIGGGHDFFHALRVAGRVLNFVEDPIIAELAWVAAICHNTDRIYGDVFKEMALSRYKEIFLDVFPEAKWGFIEDAIHKHSGPNDVDDSPVLIALQDADRIVNLEPDLPMRSGAHYHRLPVANPRFIRECDPEATYRDPKTVLHDVKCSLDWVAEEGPVAIRTPKAREIALPLAEHFRRGVELLAECVADAGLDPYPFPEDCS